MKNERLYPKWTNPNWYGLIQLRKKTEIIIEKYFESNNYKLIDYGCGSKPYYELYKKKVKDYIGADIQENTKADIIIDKSTGKISVEDNCSDFIVSTQVLEHVDDYDSYLKEASRVCKPNGLLILSTHGFFPYHPDPNDYWRWTASGLIKILEKNGWNIVDYEGIIGFSGVGLSFIQYSFSKKMNFIFRTPFVVFMQRLIMIIDKYWYKKKESRNENSVIYVFVAKNKK